MITDPPDFGRFHSKYITRPCRPRFSQCQTPPLTNKCPSFLKCGGGSSVCILVSGHAPWVAQVSQSGCVRSHTRLSPSSDANMQFSHPRSESLRVGHAKRVSPPCVSPQDSINPTSPRSETLHPCEHAARPISGPSVCGTCMAHFITFGTILAVESLYFA